MAIEAEVLVQSSTAPPTSAAAVHGGQGKAEGSGRVAASSRWSPLRALTSRSKTNENMLIFRTLNRDMGRPNANSDHLAALFRDRLMPLRSKWLEMAPGARAAFRRGLEHPRLGTPGVCNFVDARTKWLDDAVQEALLSDGITQVVVVAAGFDTRSYRFGAAMAAKRWPVTFMEVDLPEASRKKQELVESCLSPSAYPRPVYVAADLAHIPLMDALEGVPAFDRSKPTLFTMEGLVYYLPEESVARLLGSIASFAAPGSRVCFDFLSRQVLEGELQVPAYKVTARSVANKGEPFISGIQDSAAGVQAFFDGPVLQAAAGAAAAGRRIKLKEYLNAQQMVARQLPHLSWPDSESNKPPPTLAFYSFVSAEVVQL